jgi:ketosteroid isomerase-like protein
VNDTAILERLAIRELIDRYVDCLNHRDWAGYGELLADDFLWTCSAPHSMRIESRAAMLEMVSTVQQYQFGFVFQMAHGLVIDDQAADRARCRHTLHIVSDKSTMLGIYYDIVEKGAGGRWRFHRRDYRITYLDDSPAPGRVYRTLPDTRYRELPGP